MQNFFQVDRPVFEASAPGRLDVMGGVADYSGSLVLQMPIVERTSIRVQITAEDCFTVVSVVDDVVRRASIPVKEVLSWRDTRPVHANKARHAQPSIFRNHWTRYILSCFLLVSKVYKFGLKGARIYVTSDVPIGAGLSSSAALEVATMRVLAKAYKLNFNSLELPKLAWHVENEIIGAPCGLMEHVACHYGKLDELLPISCQPAKLHATISIPSDIIFERVPSGVEHSISNDAYTTARTAAFMGYGILAKQMGATDPVLKLAKESLDWSGLPLHGFLVNFEAKNFEANIENKLPLSMRGSEFIAKGYINIDSNTTVDPDRLYPVRAATAHPVYENACIHQFASLLAQIDQIDMQRHQVFTRLGLLMLSSHASYSAIGLGHDAADHIVHEVVAKGANRGFYGARVTSRGCEGTVVVLRRA